MNKVKKGSLNPSRPRRFRICRHLSSKFALGSKLPLVTLIARTGLDTRLKERVWELKEKGVVTAFTA